ncbi:MAG: LysR family transcriptional regulator, hydrogen peroxide-inducible s activator [Actinomycetota bacterium]|nr:LysR family transcriptional regulator, hydrogen peroxide-inducible s activator [Actinomycetota bacterium]
MNLRDLEYLVAVAEHRHFGKAAAACHVSQPTLSIQLKKLESELGALLLERGPRMVVLTPAGEDIVVRARRILADADAIRTAARRSGSPYSGGFRLGIFPTLAAYLLPHVVPVLHRRYPHLELLLTEEKTAVLRHRINDGQLDAVILALPTSDPLLATVPLFREDFLLAVPADHPLAGSDGPVDPSVLADEPLLLLDEGHCLRDQVLQWCHSTGNERFSGFRATSLETLRFMVASGVGVTLLPRLATAPPVGPCPTTRIITFTDPAPHRDVGLVYRPTSPLADLMPPIADLLRTLPPGLVRPLAEP